jgi:hypothetical protein
MGTQSSATMPHPIGTLIKARAREWVVLPESTDDLLMCANPNALCDLSRKRRFHRCAS